MPAPPGVVQGGARHCDEVCLAARDYFLSLLGIRDQTHRDGCSLAPIADGVGERHVIAWADGNFLLWRNTPGRYCDPVDATLLKCLREGNRLFQIPAFVYPVGGRDLDPQWHSRRQNSAYGVVDL